MTTSDIRDKFHTCVFVKIGVISRAFLLHILVDIQNVYRVYIDVKSVFCSVYNMSGRVVSDLQPRAEGEWL
jgi:hypothetical protein